MKRYIKNFLSLALVFAVAIVLIPSQAFASGISYNKTQTLYMDSRSGASYGTLYINDLAEGQSVNKKHVKSSNTKVAAIYYVSKGQNSWGSESFYDETSSDVNEENENYSSGIGLKLKKAGKTTVSFKVDNKTYKSVINVKAYSNPFKSIKISGVKNGKNIASLFNKKSNGGEATLSKTTKNASINVSMKSGWKLTSISLYESNTGSDIGVSKSDGGLGSFSVPSLSKAKTSSIHFSVCDKMGNFRYFYMTVR